MVTDTIMGRHHPVTINCHHDLLPWMTLCRLRSGL